MVPPLVGQNDPKPKIYLKTFNHNKREGHMLNMRSLSQKTKKVGLNFRRFRQVDLDGRPFILNDKRQCAVH